MPDLPPLAPGFVRLVVHLRPMSAHTPGGIARACGLAPEHLGPIVIDGTEAYIDVAAEHGRDARAGLGAIGSTQLIERRWQWLRLAVGRNHGLTMGQLKRVLQGADAHPVGKIVIQNTHTLVGLVDAQIAPVAQRLSSLRINGYAAKPTALPPGTGPGSPAYSPKSA